MKSATGIVLFFHTNKMLCLLYGYKNRLQKIKTERETTGTLYLTIIIEYRILLK